MGGDMDYWEKIVVLRMNDTAPKRLAIKNSRDAARVLLKSWPTKEGMSYRRAVLNCSAAVHGRVPQDLAQWSFIVAAMEATLSYEIIDRLDTEIADVCQQLLAEDMLLQEPTAPADKMAGSKPPFWWPKRQASGPSAQ
jgi:hypothetical protein